MRHHPMIVAFGAVAEIAIAMTSTRVLTAQDLPVKRTMLVQTELVGVDGKHANM